MLYQSYSADWTGSHAHPAAAARFAFNNRCDIFHIAIFRKSGMKNNLIYILQQYSIG
jgi:hypothetical protein